MKVKLLIFLGLALVGIHGMSAPIDVPAMDGWPAALDEAIGAHQEYVAVREARIEALRQQLSQTDTETQEMCIRDRANAVGYTTSICTAKAEISNQFIVLPVSRKLQHGVTTGTSVSYTHLNINY